MSLEGKLVSAVDKAFRSLDDLAGAFTINEIDTTSYNATTGVPAQTTTAHAVEGIFDNFETDRLDGTLIETEELRVLIKPIDAFKPSVGDELIADSITYTIMNVESIRAYDKDFLWELHVRK